MANIDVVYRDALGNRAPNLLQVVINAGDTVTFSVEDGADSTLYFSPETAAILSPTPDAQVDLPTGSTLTYTFASADPGAYGVVALAPDASAPESFNFGLPANPPVLALHAGRGPGFGIRDTPVET